MKRNFKADPINILGAVLVILLAFTVFVTVFLLVGYERLLPAENNAVTTTEERPSSDIPSLSDIDSGYMDGTANVTQNRNEDSVSSTDEYTSDSTFESPETSDPTESALPSETTSSPETTQPADTNQKVVALTFDDGPHATYTFELLKVLDKYNVKATFFVLGTNIRGEARINALKQTAAAGHEIANHSYSHPTVLNLTADEFIADVEKASKIIYETCGVKPAVIRTPGGKFSTEILEKIQYPIIHWTVDTRDWEHNDPEKCLENLKKQVSDGAVILMHDRKSNTARSVELMIEWLLDNGYKITTVSELMEIKGTELTAGKVYYSSSIFKPKD